MLAKSFALPEAATIDTGPVLQLTTSCWAVFSLGARSFYLGHHGFRASLMHPALLQVP